MNNSTGQYLLEKDARWTYHTFIPNPLPLEKPFSIDDETADMLSKAHFLLGRIDGIIKYMSCVDKYMDLLKHYECVLSNQISGLDIGFLDLYDESSKQHRETPRIATYVSALHQGITSISQSSITLNTIKTVHKALLENDTPENAGQFRNTPLITQRVFTNILQEYNPPNPNDMVACLRDFEKYVNSKCNYDVLIQCALAYYQFMTIQPFEQGNGRMSRLLLSLLMTEKGLIKAPILCMSYFQLVNSGEYLSTLDSVRRGYAGYEPWVKFFIKSVIIAAERTIQILESLYTLRNSNYERMYSLGKISPVVIKIYEHLWEHPIIEVRHLAMKLELSYNTVAKAVHVLENLNILEKMTAQKRYQRYLFADLAATFSELSSIT